MCSRFSVAVLIVTILLSVLSYAQESSDVIVGSFKDGYGTTLACGTDGVTFLTQRDRTSHNPMWPVSGASRDGSIVKFQLPDVSIGQSLLPEGATPLAAAASRESDLFILAQYAGMSDDIPEMFHFDNQANLLTRQRMNLGFHPQEMAVLDSGNAVIVGMQDGHDQNDWKNVGVVIDAEGLVLARFKFPLPPEGGGWTFVSRWMLAWGDAAYIMLHSYDPPATGLAKISEDGQLDIKIVSSPHDTDQRHHNEWTFGPGVAVEIYHYVGERSTFHYDEYDLNTGQKTVSRYAFISGSPLGCYGQNDVSMVARSTRVDPARRMSPDTMLLVFADLHDQAESAPVVNPEKYNRTATSDPHP
jgi:hypothetical protein